MGQASGGMTNESERFCLCMLDKNYIEVENQNWLRCENCKNWYHSKCVLLSDEEYERIEKNNEKWFCHEFRCQEIKDVSDNTNGRTDRSYFYRKCKSKKTAVIEQIDDVEIDIQTTINSNENELLVPCLICNDGKLYKRKGGLKIHCTRKHKNDEIDFMFKQDSNNDFIPNGNFEESLTYCKNNIRVLRRIPKGARYLAATKLSEAIENCTTKNDEESWQHLMLFAYKGLMVPEKLNKKQSLNSKIKENLNCLKLPTPKQPEKLSSGSTIKVIESKVADGDIKGAIRTLTSDASFIPPSEETLIDLKSKHPTPSRDLNFPIEPDLSASTFEVTEDTVKNGIKGFKNGSAAGMDGIFPQVLKDLTSVSAGEAGVRLLLAITTLCTLISKGQICKSICPYFYGALLISLAKKDGGIRPIAIGNTFRRLTARLACRAIRNRTNEYLFPKQLGFGILRGCEAIVHALRTFIKLNKGLKKVILKIDMKNAFNCIERDVMLHAVKEQVPELFAMFWQAYRLPSKLFYGDHTIVSARGAQQGDPGGPLLFSLAIHGFVKFLSSSFNCFYLDDGTLGDDPLVVLQDFQTIIEKSKEIGLEINPKKCELFFIDDINQDIVDRFNQIAPGIKIITKENFTLLGSPITFESVRLVASQKLELLKKAFDTLRKLNMHTAFFLMKNCLSMPKLVYFLRTSPLWLFSDIISEIDNNIKSCIESILQLKLEDRVWLQASLPISKGGLSLRCVKDICLPAFIASSYGVSKIVKSILQIDSDDLEIFFVKDALTAWRQLNDISPQTDHSWIQRKWDEINTERVSKSILNEFELENRARFLALQQRESNHWLHAFPSPHLGTFMDNLTFKILIALRLGIKICQVHQCRCGELCDQFGHHSLRCKKSAGRIPRHKELNNIIYRALNSLNIPSLLEPPGISRLDGKRADGVTIMPWINGKSLLWDATCTDTLCKTNLSSTCRTAGSAAEKKVFRKRIIYGDMIKNYQFIVFSTETMGPWCQEGKDLIDDLGIMLSKMTGDQNSSKYLKQRISIAIQRGNAMSVLKTLPETEGLDEIYNL